MGEYDPGRINFLGDYSAPGAPFWASYTQATPANAELSTLTINPYPTGNILLQHSNVGGQEYNAPLIFQRPAADINAPSESLVMNLSQGVPGYPIDGEFITATKDSGTAYDDIAVNGIQIFGNQTTTGNAGAAGYITNGPFPNTIDIRSGGVFMSSLTVSSLSVVNVVSSSTSASSNYTATEWMSTPILYAEDLKATRLLTISSIIGSGDLTMPSTIVQSDTVETSEIQELNVSTIKASTIFLSSSIYTPILNIVDSTYDVASEMYGNIGGELVIRADKFGVAQLLPPYNPTFTIFEDLTAQFTSSLTAPTLQTFQLKADTISTSQISTAYLDVTDTISASNMNISSLFAHDITASTLKASTINLETASIVSLSSLIGDITFNLVSSLQFKAELSPNVNLGLGNVIQGLIGGAATQGMAVTVGAAGLITGATALITGRQSGGVNSSVFQTVNGSTQLQFSTIGTSQNSVFLTTSSSDPLHTPGALSSQTQVIDANTYCMRSVGDPLNVDSSTDAIQMFGQWVPVIQPSASILLSTISTSYLNASSINTLDGTVSTLNISTLNGSPYYPGTFVIPSSFSASTITQTGNLTQVGSGGTLLWNKGQAYFSSIAVSSISGIFNCSSINMTGNLINTNLEDTLIWYGNSEFYNTTVESVTFKDTAYNPVGAMTGTDLPGASILIVPGNGLSIANATTRTVTFNNNNTIQMFSTLIVPSITGTTNISTVVQSGNLTNTNTAATMTWLGQTVLSNAGTRNLNFLDAGGFTRGQMVGTDFLNAGINMLVNNGLTINNGLTNTNLAIYYPDTTVKFFSTVTIPYLNVSTVNGLPPNTSLPSTVFLSTVNVNGGLSAYPFLNTSSFTVSSINGQPPGTTLIPSTINTKTTKYYDTNTNYLVGGIWGGDNRTTLYPGLNLWAEVNPDEDYVWGTIAFRYGSQFSESIYASFLAPAVVGEPPTFFLQSDIRSPYHNIFGSNVLSSKFQLLDSEWDNSNTGFITGGRQGAGTQGVNIFSGTVPGTITLADKLAANGENPLNTIATFNASNGFGSGPLTTLFNSAYVTNQLTVGSDIFASNSITASSNLTAPAIYNQNLYTGNVSVTSNISASNVFISNSVSVPSFYAQNIVASNSVTGNIITADNEMITPNLYANNLSNVQTINGAPYPPPFIGANPVGAVVIWAGGSQTVYTPPTGYLTCDGTQYLQSAYPALFAVIGQTYLNQCRSPGTFNPNTQFVVPDLTFAVPMGAPNQDYGCYVTYGTYNTSPGPTVTIPNVTVYTNAVWIIQSCTGTINVGTFFPGIGDNNQGMYIQQILVYGGTGVSYVLMGNSTGSPTFPVFPGNSTIFSQGVISRQPVQRGEVYQVGNFGFLGERNVARKQQPTEVGEHTHTFTSGGGTSYNVSGGNLAIGSNPVPTSEPNTLPTINGTQVAQPYPTAPNYINMFYLIKY